MGKGMERTASRDDLIKAFSIPFKANETASLTVNPALRSSSAAAASLGFSLIEAVNYRVSNYSVFFSPRFFDQS